MRPQFTWEDLCSAKGSKLLELECEYCDKSFYLEAKYIRSYVKRFLDRSKYCSKDCTTKSKNKKIEVQCLQCSLIFIKNNDQCIKTPNHFCSHSCAAKYNNAHKTHGTRRSKLEKWLEEQLTILYPELNILFNQKSAINSELDIHIPSLNLAFELNGIFHYEPIYGKEKLASILNNDDRKFQACLEKSIELVIIDTSKQTYFKDTTSKKYLDIITQIINLKLSVHSPGLEPGRP